MKIERKRFVVMRNNRTEIWGGIAQHYKFRPISDIGEFAIKTYRTHKQALSSCSSWDRNFEVVPIVETITDEEVIKALECCISGYCIDGKCPLFDWDDEDDISKCTGTLATIALDLVKRQKAETAYWMDEAANAKKESVKDFAERLKKKLIENGTYPVLAKNTIDRLLKEMEEEKE